VHEAVIDEEPDGMRRADRGQDRRLAHHPRQPRERDADEPDQGDGTEDGAHAGGSAALHEEQSGEDRDGERHDPERQRRRRHLESLDGAQHGDRRRDDAVAVEQGRAEEPEGHERRGASRRSQQGEQREDAALATVVGPHDEGEVLDHDDQEECPEHQRENAEHVLVRRGDAVPPAEALLDGVERRRPDVAVHDAERSQHEPRQPGSVVRSGTGQ
jgi:hypothetical protein